MSSPSGTAGRNNRWRAKQFMKHHRRDHAVCAHIVSDKGRPQGRLLQAGIALVLWRVRLQRAWIHCNAEQPALLGVAASPPVAPTKASDAKQDVALASTTR